jgi:hypothetical protein
MDFHAVGWDGAGVGLIMKCSIAGCNNHPTTLASVTDTQPIAMAVDSTSVYWTQQTTAVITTGAVMKCAVSGCNNHPTVVAGGTTVSSIAVDSASIYWSNFYLLTCPLAGCGGPPQRLSGGLGEIPVALAVDSAGVRWTAEGANSVGFVEESGLDGGAVTTLSRWQVSDNPYGIATDGADVYWTEGSAVRRCAVTGCGGHPTTVGCAPQGRAYGVAVDSASVYWSIADPTNGSVMRAPK